MPEPQDNAAGGAGTGNLDAPANWLESLPADLTYTAKGADGVEVATPLNHHPKLKEFKGVADLANAWMNQERELGKPRGLVAPGKDATDEQRAAFAAELRKLNGVPDTPEGYGLKLPQGVTADEDLLGWFRQTAHKLGMSPSAAQQFMEDYNAFAAQKYQAMEAKYLADAKAAVEKLWGAEAPAAVETAKRGFLAVAAKAGLDQETSGKFIGLYGNEPAFLQVFKALGDLYKEDTHVDGGAGGGVVKPKRDSEVFYGQKQT